MNKKKLIAFICSFLFYQIAFSQINITANEFPKPGSSFNRIYGVTGDTAALGTAGPNGIYNFYDLYTWAQDSVKYLNADSTPFTSNHTQASVAQYFPSVDISVYWYYSSDSYAFWKSGYSLFGDFGSGVDTIHSEVLQQDVDTTLATNWTYGSNWYGNWRFPIPIDSVTTYQLGGNKWVNVDGWGRLVTPTNTWDTVLRMKIKEYKLDTVFYTSVPVDYKSESLYYYNFYAKDVSHPVLIAHTDSTYNNIDYIEYLLIQPKVYGCTDPNAINFNALANTNDSSCIYCSAFSYSIAATDTNICKGDPITILASGGTSYLWSTNETTASINVIPDSTTIYSVYISNQTYCYELSNIKINVSEKVTASFWTSQNTYNLNDNALFVNNSVKASTYFWNFNDSINSTSYDENPQHVFVTSGIKNISLVASNSCYADTFKTTLTINAIPIGIVEHNLKVFPNPYSNGTFIRYLLKNDANVKLSITDMLGRTTNILENVQQNKGEYSYNLQSLNINLKSGIYFVELKIDQEIIQKKLIVTNY